LRCVDLCLNKGGIDPILYHLPQGQLFDFAVLVTGRSERQVHAIVDEVLHFCKRSGIHHHPVEGGGGWQLIDCFDVVVHALTAELREFYRLDRLWPGSEIIDHDSGLAGLPKLPDAAASTGGTD